MPEIEILNIILNIETNVFYVDKCSPGWIKKIYK